jgi:hypothetical protein
MVTPLLAVSTLGLIVLIVVLLILAGSVPVSRTRGWGYGGPSVVGLIFVVLLILVLLEIF